MGDRKVFFFPRQKEKRTNTPCYYSIKMHLRPDKLIMATDNWCLDRGIKLKTLMQRNGSLFPNNCITQNRNTILELKKLKYNSIFVCPNQHITENKVRSTTY